MLPEKPKSGLLYLLPKIHKKYDKIPKGRPIIPGCGSNTELISWFCDQSVKEKVKPKDSYIEDTPDILRFFEELNEGGTLPADAKPVTIDLKSMYTNIPIEPTALLPSSAHPGHITSNIVYSMAFRILRICSEKRFFGAKKI